MQLPGSGARVAGAVAVTGGGEHRALHVGPRVARLLKARVEEAFAAGLLRREGEERDRPRVGDLLRRADEDAPRTGHRQRAARSCRVPADGNALHIDLPAELSGG